jgi:hypothetical protein
LAIHFLLGNFLPHAEEDVLECVDLVAGDTTVQVTPWADGLGAIDVIISYVHASCVGYLSVDDDYFAVVAVKQVVNPWEAYRVELIDLYAFFANSLYMSFLQWSVIGEIAETVEECSDLNALFGFLSQEVEQQMSDGVVSEVEVFEMDAAFGLSDIFEQMLEFLLSRGE